MTERGLDYYLQVLKISLKEDQIGSSKRPCNVSIHTLVIKSKWSSMIKQSLVWRDNSNQTRVPGVLPIFG